MSTPDLIDLRSDTVTRPTAAMREAMAKAEVGDDVYGEDPTVRRLEERAAEIVGKEGALFVPSGTMANQIALLLHTRRGDEVIGGEGTHSASFESGAAAALSGVQFRIAGKGGLFTAEELERAVQPPGIMYPRSVLAVVENTHNRAGGRVFAHAEVLRIARVARRRGLRLHLDGARLWNAAIATGQKESELAAPFDTVSICFSKGLGAPIGSALCASRALVDEARRHRKMLGGGMRQAGVIASAALFGLENNRARLADDHRTARLIAERVASAKGASVDVAGVETNIVNVRLLEAKADAVVSDARRRGLLVNATGPDQLRAVTHLDAPPERAGEAAERLCRAIEAVLGGDEGRHSIRIAPLAAALTVAACGGAANEVSPKEAAAERAYSAGRYLEAAERFSEAAEASPRVRDREEARYRQAMSLQRAGRPEEARAVLEAMQKTFPRGARAPRAAYDAALIDIARGRESDGFRALDALVRRYPESGPSSAALRRYLEWLGKTGEDRVRAYLEELRPKVEKTELVQYVDYEHARSLERSGAVSAARAEYLAVADRYPYPKGVFWDDSLFRAAELEAARGAPREAIAHFERLLADREPAIMQGSYERARYAQAAFRIGELYRDALHDRRRAREAFERMWATNTTSRLRDDAMWSASVIAADSGDGEGACRNLRSLIEENPDSRYAPCATSLCPAIRAVPGGRPCHEYLLGKGP